MPTMNIRDYLHKNNLKPTPWAVDNKIAPSVISRYLSGRGLSKENALKIQNATGGAVSIMELLYPEQSTAEPTEQPN